MAVALAATLAATTDARARSYTIQTSKGFITSIGSLRIWALKLWVGAAGD